MSSVINTNVMSLNAQRNLTSSSAELATSLQRLSSGLRINSAKDDAAGLAISQRFTTQIRGMDVAARNANDGISLAQTAEGALSSIGDNLQRIRELAVQSRNATNSMTDRAALDAEAQQLSKEIDRVAKDTNFNGVNLLDGTFTAKAFQVGANQGQTIDISSIVNAKSTSLGEWNEKSTYTYSGSVSTAMTVSTTNYADAINATINGVKISVAAGSTDATTAQTAFETAFATAKTANPDALANVSMAAGGAVTFSDASIKISGLTNIAGQNGVTEATTTTEHKGQAMQGFSSLDLTSEDGADNAILAMDAALTAVNSARADLGAIQNRFTSVVSNLSTTSENLSTARSRIQDTDYAKESAQLTRNQILQQAGTAMLAQANQSTQSVLKLIS